MEKAAVHAIGNSILSATGVDPIEVGRNPMLEGGCGSYVGRRGMDPMLQGDGSYDGRNWTLGMLGGVGS